MLPAAHQKCTTGTTKWSNRGVNRLGRLNMSHMLHSMKAFILMTKNTELDRHVEFRTSSTQESGQSADATIGTLYTGHKNLSES